MSLSKMVMADEGGSSEADEFTAARISYIIESAIYALAMVLGFAVCCYTTRRFNSNYRRHVILAARLMRFKISLTVADLIVLYVYAPTQIIWIITYNWYGGDFLCRTTKFINTFSLHLTANMQVLIAADRLYITAHLRQVHQKSRFAANQIIALAWLLAIACALPQLLVFHVYILPNGKPQCVSIWTVMRFREYLRQEAEEMRFLEKTLQNISSETSMHDTGIVDDAAVEMDVHNSDLLKVLEHSYNALHLISIYILPYSIELFCYASILILMKRIHSDGVKQKPAKKRRCCFQWMAPTPQNSSVDYCTDKEVSTTSLVRHSEADVNIMDIRAQSGAGGGSSRMMQKRSRCLSAPALKPLNRRYNEVLVVDRMKQRRSSVAWKNTVALARRKTRRKAFLMLTLNMIFWTPYCVMGILSTIMVFDHSGYDFVNALVVLNAVSNLLL